LLGSRDRVAPEGAVASDADCLFGSHGK
jgi:hypothetical protein